MEWLNYHHFLYFYMVAREGGISNACEVLRLAPSTVSVQIKTLEDALGEDLFERSGRSLVLTERGQVAYSYAEEIFGLGQEMLETFHSQPTGRPVRLRVGVCDVLSKDIAHQLLEPALQLDPGVHLICREGTQDELLAELAIHNVDVVLADAPIGPTVNIKAFNHLLGHCGAIILASEAFVSEYGHEFPRCLDGAPFLMPTSRSAFRRHLEQWFESVEVSPQVVGEFDDSALMATFGAAGVGAFASPSVVEHDVSRQFGVQILGVAERVQQSFYAISVERKIKHPAVQAICDAARQTVFR